MALDPQAPPEGRCVATPDGIVRRYLGAHHNRGFAATVRYEAIVPRRAAVYRDATPFTHEITLSAWRSWAKGGTVLPEDWTPEQGTAAVTLPAAEVERLRAIEAAAREVAARWGRYCPGCDVGPLIEAAGDLHAALTLPTPKPSPESP